MSDSNSEDRRIDVFDPAAEVFVTSRNLPHWFQEGAATFITFRTSDSMPKNVVAAWRRDLQQWLVSQGFDSSIAEVKGREKQLPRPLLRAYQRMSNQRWLDRLDQCHGACLLRQPPLAKIVGDALSYFDGERYDLDCYVVMPNHVHLLVQFRSGTTLAAQTKSWQRYTAREINKSVGRTGRFWQGEPFDHLVRSEEQFHYIRRYIAENPVKARLKEGEYLYWNGHVS